MESDLLIQAIGNCIMIFALIGFVSASVMVSDTIIDIMKKIHCHRIMTKGKEHKCRYWTCDHYTRCPYNTAYRDSKLPKYITKHLEESEK